MSKTIHIIAALAVNAKGEHDTFEIVDDGPFPGDGGSPEAFKSIAPSGGRQRLLAQLQKNADGKPTHAVVSDTLDGIFVDAGAIGSVPLLQANPKAKAPTDVIAKVTAQIARLAPETAAAPPEAPKPAAIEKSSTTAKAAADAKAKEEADKKASPTAAEKPNTGETLGAAVEPATVVVPPAKAGK